MEEGCHDLIPENHMASSVVLVWLRGCDPVAHESDVVANNTCYWKLL